MTSGKTMGIVGVFTPSTSGMAAENWLLCDSRELKVDDYPALFARIGARFGDDGVNSFALPKINGDVPNGGLPFVVYWTGYFPLEGAGPAEWPLVAEAETLIERQAQVMKDAYARGEDPHFRHPTPAEAEINERVAALMAVHAEGQDPQSTLIAPSPAGATYGVEIRGQSDGLIQIQVLAPKNRQFATIFVFEDLATTSSSVAWLQVAGNGAGPVLENDLDGDGQVDQVLEPVEEVRVRLASRGVFLPTLTVNE